MFCPQCGKEIAEGQAFCQYCGARLEAAGQMQPAAGRSKIPWEERGSLGFFTGLFRTAREVLFRPSDFFRKMPVSGGLTDPLLFALITGMTGLMFLYVWDILLHNSIQDFMTPEMKAAAGRTIFGGGAVSSAGAVLTPFMLIVCLFLASGMLHLFLSMARGAKAGFEATFRVVGYGMSPFLFMIIPYCGALITQVWMVVLAIIGIKEAHETTGGKAAFAVLFPFLFCCGLAVVAAALFMGAVAASFGAMIHMSK